MFYFAESHTGDHDAKAIINIKSLIAESNNDG